MLNNQPIGRRHYGKKLVVLALTSLMFAQASARDELAYIESHPWSKCTAKVNKPFVEEGRCGSGGCFEEDGTPVDVEKVCGPHPKELDKAWKRHVAKGEADQAKLDAIVIRIGSRESDVVAKYGNPNSVTKSVGKWGVHRQLVYRHKGLIFYTENGKVSSWQEISR